MPPQMFAYTMKIRWESTAGKCPIRSGHDAGHKRRCNKKHENLAFVLLQSVRESKRPLIEYSRYSHLTLHLHTKYFNKPGSLFRGDHRTAQILFVDMYVVE